MVVTRFCYGAAHLNYAALRAAWFCVRSIGEYTVETRRLQLFIEIADAGSISRAAAHIGIAQPALSQQLAVLEHELKVKLLERSSQGVRLTSAGRKLYGQAQLILRHVDGLSAHLHGDEEVIAGTVSIGLMSTQSNSIGSPLLALASQEFPHVKLHIREGLSTVLLPLIEAGSLDMVVGPVQRASPNVESTPLFREELKIVQATGLEPPPQDLATLARCKWVLSTSPNLSQSLLRGLFSTVGAEPNIVLEVTSLPLMLTAVTRGMGMTLLPQASVDAEVERGELEIWPFPTQPLYRTIHISVRRDPPPSPAENAMRELLLRIVRQKPDIMMPLESDAAGKPLHTRVAAESPREVRHQPSG